MKQYMKKIQTTFRRLLAVLLILGLISALMCRRTGAADSSKLDSLKSQASTLSSQESTLQTQLDELADQEAAKLDEKAVLEQQISVISAEIFNTQQIIEEYDVRIADKLVELEAAEAEAEDYYELFCLRVRAEEEQGSATYWEILFGASSFADLLDRFQTIASISRYDNQVVEDLRAARQAVADAEKELEDEQTEQKEYKEELETEEASLSEAEAAVEAAIEEIDSQSETYAAQLAEIEAEEAELDEQIAAAQKEYDAQVAAEEAAKAAASSSSSSYSYGSGRISMVWPCASHAVSSYYGSRTSPTAGASSNHKGIDISASTGTAIYAAAGGTVSEAAYSSSRGNYVIIYHGSGVSTLYQHCSAVYVSAGQSVSQGQTIAAVGSTGISTGSHLHFGVLVDGAYVNPLNYVK